MDGQTGRNCYIDNRPNSDMIEVYKILTNKYDSRVTVTHDGIQSILERLVLTRLRPLLGSAKFSEYQSAYRKGHSTETALLEVLDGVYMAVDNTSV